MHTYCLFDQIILKNNKNDNIESNVKIAEDKIDNIQKDINLYLGKLTIEQKIQIVKNKVKQDKFVSNLNKEDKKKFVMKKKLFELFLPDNNEEKVLEEVIKASKPQSLSQLLQMGSRTTKLMDLLHLKKKQLGQNYSVKENQVPMVVKRISKQEEFESYAFNFMKKISKKSDNINKKESTKSVLSSRSRMSSNSNVTNNNKSRNIKSGGLQNTTRNLESRSTAIISRQDNRNTTISKQSTFFPNIRVSSQTIDIQNEQFPVVNKKDSNIHSSRRRLNSTLY